MFFKDSPKIVVIVASLIVIAFITLTLGDYIKYNGGLSEGNIDKEVRTWLQENFIDRDYMKFELSLITYHNIDTDGEDTTLPDDIVLYSYDHYLVSTIRDDQKVKIEHISTEYEYNDPTQNHTDTYTDQIYFIQIEEDKLYYYYPDESGAYEVRVVDDKNFANEASKLLFPTDLSLLVRDDLKPLNKSKKDINIATEYYATYYDTTTQPLYPPFAIVKGDDPEHLGELVSYTFKVLDLVDDIEFSDEQIEFEIYLNRMEQFFAYAYEAWTEKPYQNDLIKNEYPYEQVFNLCFYHNYDAPIEFELPKI